MIEVRHIETGAVRWQGDDPSTALAAVLALNDNGAEHVIVGATALELDGELPPAPDPLTDSDESYAAANAEREEALSRLAARDVQLSDVQDEVRPAGVINGVTGDVEQVFEDRKAAEEHAARLNGQEVEHQGERVRFRVE